MPTELPPRAPPGRRLDRDLRMLRRLLLAILVLGLVGTSIDLLLLDHYADAWQLIPLILLGLAIVVFAWHLAARGAASVYAIRALMTALIVGGLAGGVLHFQASAAARRSARNAEG